MGSLRNLRQNLGEEKKELTLNDLKRILASMTPPERRVFYQDLEGKPSVTVQEYLDILNGKREWGH